MEALPLPLPGCDPDSLCGVGADTASPAGLPRVMSLDFMRCGLCLWFLVIWTALLPNWRRSAQLQRRPANCAAARRPQSDRYAPARSTPFPLPLPRLTHRAFRGEAHVGAFEPACSGSEVAALPLPEHLALPLPGVAAAATMAEGVETPTCLAAQPGVAALMHSSSLQLGAALPLPAAPVPLPVPAMVPTSTLGVHSMDGTDSGAALSLPSRPGSVCPASGHTSDGPCQATSSKPKAAAAAPGGKAAAAPKGGKAGGKPAGKGGKDRASMTQAEKAALRRARRWAGLGWVGLSMVGGGWVRAAGQGQAAAGAGCFGCVGARIMGQPSGCLRLLAEVSAAASAAGEHTAGCCPTAGQAGAPPESPTGCFASD